MEPAVERLAACCEGVSSLSAAQFRYWLLHELDPQDPAQNVSIAVALRGSLNIAALELSLQYLCERHEILRMVFSDDDGEPVAKITRPIAVPLAVVDTLQSEAERLAAEEGRRPFDLEQGPIFHARLFRLEPSEHILVLAAHRIAADGRSLEVLRTELAVAYEAFCAGRQPAIPEVAYSYRDYMEAEGQRASLPASSGELPVLQLPADRQEASGAARRGAIEIRTIPPDLFEAVRKFGSTAVTMLAAFQALLHRYSGQTEIVLAAPSANRRPETRDLVGPLETMLVLRNDLSADPVFRDLAARAGEILSDAVAHAGAVPAQNCRASFAHRKAGDSEVRMAGGVCFRELAIDFGTLQFDLSLAVSELPDRLTISLEYDAGLFDRSTIDRLLGHYEILLGGAVEGPDQKVSALPLLQPAEQQRLLVEWNRTFAEFPFNRSMIELFEERARNSAGSTAVRFGDRSLTYSELDARANMLAATLTAKGGGPGLRIGISMDRSPEMVIAILAIWKAGSAYVPLDPSYPEERLAFVVEDAQVSIVLTGKDGGSRIPAIRGRALPIDGTKLAVRSDGAPASRPSPADVAYVLYTSGSTGRPKGVEVTHRSFVNLVTSIAREPGFSAADTLLSITSLSFDIAGLEVFLPLLTGGCCILASPGAARDPVVLIREIARYRPSVLQATPATWRMLVEAGWTGDPNMRLFTGGEALPRELASALLARCREFWNLYGPTETTIYSTGWRVEPTGTILIGRPLANTTLYVVGPEGQPLPVGVPGELLIGGEGLARGYLGRPELTAERFIRNPFSDDPESRVYRTGDLARYREDGQVELLGRMDHQTKIRGYRVELGEIETVLEQSGDVRQAVVVAREDRPGDRRLVGYVIPREAGAGSATGLRDHLARHLPEYMLPAAFVFLKRLPLTPNGKIDRASLPAPEMPAPCVRKRSPKTRLELQLLRIWESVLGVRPIGLDDNFFELGGHSLMALRLTTRVEKTLGVKLPISTLFKTPTIELMARLIAQQGVEPNAGVLVPIQTSGSRPPLFCIHGVGGNILSYGHLARYLPDDQPLYGLQARGLEGMEPPHTRIEDMAADYIRQVRSVQPAGPYYFAGFSFGGVVGFEMARQLEAAGEKVGLLLLLDTGAYGALNTLPRREFWRAVLRRQVRRLRLHCANLAGMSLRARMEYLRRRLQTIRRKTGNRIWQLRYKSYEMLRRPVPRSFQNVKEAAYLAVRQYMPGPYRGKAVLFRAEQRSALYDDDPALGWSRLILGGVEVHTVPGDHNTIAVGANAALLARQIMGALERNQEPETQEAVACQRR